MRHQPHTRLSTPRAPPSCRSQPHPARILPQPHPSLYPSVPKQYYSFFLQHCTHATAGALGKSYPTVPSCNLAPASRAWCSRVVCVRVRQCARLIKKKNAGDREGERMCARPTARIHLRVCAYTCNRKMQGGEGVSEERSQNSQAQHRLQCLGVRVLEDVVPASRRKGKL